MRRKVLALATAAWATMCVAVIATAMPTTAEQPAEPEPVVIVVPVWEPEPSPEPEPEPVEVVTYPVPLDQELQDFIIRLCEEHHIEPGIVFAIIDRESDFRAHVIGDSGKSFGLMQIQKRWHEDRMERLGCDDLLDPYQNVTVGIDYLAELFNRSKGVEWALAAYNAGGSGANKGYGTAYAEGVLLASDALVEGVTTNVYHHR